MTLRRQQDRSGRRDEGLGLVTVMMVMGVISALAITATTLTVSNLGDARRDRQALNALATSEAGVTGAIAFLRTGNLAALTCLEAAGVFTGCDGTATSWTSRVAPVQVGLDGTVGTCTGTTDCYRVWISTLRPYAPRCAGRNLTPAQPCRGEYRIRSTGISADRTARAVTVDVEAGPYDYPMGVFSEAFSGNGNVGIHRQSLFTLGCMLNRTQDGSAGGTSFDVQPASGTPPLPVPDVFYDKPSAAHATAQISTSGSSCTGNGTHGPIHTPGNPCNATYRFDQSGQGAALSAAHPACWNRWPREFGGSYPTTSAFTEAELTQRYGYRPRGLTDAQYDVLRSQAVSTGTYNLPTASVFARLTALAGQGVVSPVLFWDTGDVDLNQNQFPPSFLRAPSDTACGSHSVTVVVSGPGSDLKYTGGNTSPWLVAALFVPDGTLTGQGGRNTIGTVFAKTVDLGGNIDFHMDRCYASNPPGGLVDVEVVDWREDDARDIS